MYREIVTKAVIGKGVISNSSEAIISVNNNVSKVLGCWIINHYFVSVLENDEVLCKGKYDLHIWYGFNNDSDTNIYKQTIEYIDVFSLKMKNDGNLGIDNELITKCAKYPTCTSLNLNDDGLINIKIEKELLLDVIGETKLRVQVTGEEWNNNDDIDSIDVDYLNK